MGFPSDDSVLPLRSVALTITHCPGEELKHAAKQTCRPGPAPGRLGPRAPRELPHDCARNRLGGSARRGARSCPGDAGARTRGAERAAASERPSPLRAASPRRACAGLSLARAA